MSQLPSAIIFINNDITDAIKINFETQLFISDTMTGQEFDSRMASDPNYPIIVHANHSRILVIRESFHDFTNRDKADLVLFYSHGLVYVEKDHNGPPQLALPLQKVNIYDLLRFVGSSEVKIYPTTAPRSGSSLGGIFAIETKDSSGIHDVNTDNEAHNKDFINRK